MAPGGGLAGQPMHPDGAFRAPGGGPATIVGARAAPRPPRPPPGQDAGPMPGGDDEEEEEEEDEELHIGEMVQQTQQAFATFAQQLRAVADGTNRIALLVQQLNERIAALESRLPAAQK